MASITYHLVCSKVYIIKFGIFKYVIVVVLEKYIIVRYAN